MKLIVLPVVTSWIFASALPQCTKKTTTSLSSIDVYSCSVKKGDTHQTCTEFRSLSANEVAYFKQQCRSDSALDVANWKTASCPTEARQGGCELRFADAENNISTSYVAWGYTATSLAALTAPAACEDVGGRILQP